MGQPEPTQLSQSQKAASARGLIPWYYLANSMLLLGSLVIVYAVLATQSWDGMAYVLYIAGPMIMLGYVIIFPVAIMYKARTGTAYLASKLGWVIVLPILSLCTSFIESLLR